MSQPLYNNRKLANFPRSYIMPVSLIHLCSPLKENLFKFFGVERTEGQGCKNIQRGEWKTKCVHHKADSTVCFVVFTHSARNYFIILEFASFRKQSQYAFYYHSCCENWLRFGIYIFCFQFLVLTCSRISLAPTKENPHGSASVPLDRVSNNFSSLSTPSLRP